MNSGISFSYPSWFVLFCLLPGAGYAALLYFREKAFDESSAYAPYFKWAMALFRFLAVSSIAILLLSPYIRYRNTQTSKPIVAILQDNSESVRYGFRPGDSAVYFRKLQALADRLSGKYEVATYSFGSAFKKAQGYPLSDKVTNISEAIDNINDLYYNQNLGAVILASDGIYNQGINPVYSASRSPYTIYTVALGDTTIPKDLRFGEVYCNKIAYLNDQFTIKADIEASYLQGRNASLSIAEINNGQEKPVAAKTFLIGTEAFQQSQEFVLPAGKTGIVHYRLSLTRLEGEASYRNNVKDVYIEVLDGRQKILLVANSPHPDIAALKSAIEANKNYQLDVAYAADFAGRLNDYNLLILHQLPAAANAATSLLEQARLLKKPLLFVAASQTNVQAFDKVQGALNMAGNANRFNDVLAKANKDFSLFTLSEATRLAITRFPPLENFFGEYKAGATAQVLLYQDINNVETDYPLWLFAEGADSKTGVIAGEGLWRWKLYDYMQNKNFDAFDELIGKTVQYLAVKGDKRPFQVSLPKSIFQDNEAIVFEAQLYNGSYELVNGPDADLMIKSEDGKEYPFKFNKTDNYYSLNAGFLPVGNYTYNASVQLGSNRYSATGRFSISALQLEELRTVADHHLLYQLAAQHGGQLYHPNDFEKIGDELLSKNTLKPVLYDTFQTESAINLKWIFFLLLLLLTAEWFLRKYLGAY